MVLRRGLMIAAYLAHHRAFDLLKISLPLGLLLADWFDLCAIHANRFLANPRANFDISCSSPKTLTSMSLIMPL